MDWLFPLEAIWLVLPAYLANASAAVLGGGTPIDFGHEWKGKRVLGDGKTWKGLSRGIVIGVIAGMLMNSFAQDTYRIGDGGMLIIFSLSCGALFGDMKESFIKRRLGKKSGTHWPIADQVDFLVGAFTFTLIMSFLLEIIDKSAEIVHISFFFAFLWSYQKRACTRFFWHRPRIEVKSFNYLILLDYGHCVSSSHCSIKRAMSASSVVPSPFKS